MKLSILIYNCDALRDLVPFIQFKKREKNMKECYSSVFQIFKIAQMVPNRTKRLNYCKIFYENDPL